MQSRARDTTTLAVGSVVSGLLAYLFFALTTRSLGATAAAPVSVLWTYWAFAAAALSFPLQHWIAQTAVVHGNRAAAARALPHVAAVVAGLAVSATLVAFAFRDPLFHSQSVWYPLLVGLATVGAAFIGVVRGGLSSQHRFIGLTATLVGENAFRCAAALALIATGDTNPADFGLVLAAGSFVGVFWPSAYRLGGDQSGGRERASLRFLGGAAGGQLIGQAVLTSGPVVLALIGGTAAQVTSLFAALALFRAPYQITLAVVAKLTGYLTTLHVRRSLDTLRGFRRSVRLATLVGVPLGGLIGAWLGPLLLPLIFGDEVALQWQLCLVLGMGSTLALTNLVTTLMIMAQGRSGTVARSWSLAAVLGLAFAVLDSQEPLARTTLAFLLAELVAFVTLTLSEGRATPAFNARSPRPSG